MGRDGNALVYLLPHEEAYVDFLHKRQVPLQLAADADDKDGEEDVAGVAGAVRILLLPPPPAGLLCCSVPGALKAKPPPARSARLQPPKLRHRQQEPQPLSAHSLSQHTASRTTDETLAPVWVRPSLGRCVALTAAPRRQEQLLDTHASHSHTCPHARTSRCVVQCGRVQAHGAVRLARTHRGLSGGERPLLSSRERREDLSSVGRAVAAQKGRSSSRAKPLLSSVPSTIHPPAQMSFSLSVRGGLRRCAAGGM